VGIATLSLLLASLLWGTSFPATEKALGGFSPGLIVFFRFFFSTLILAATASCFFNFSFKRMVTSFNLSLLLAGVLNALAFAFQFFGQAYTTASKVAIISNTFPIYTALVSPFLLGERIPFRTFFALFLAMIGVAAVGEVWNFKSINRGDVMNFIASILYAFYVINSKKALERMTSWEFVVGTGVISTFLSLLFLPIGFKFSPTPSAILAIVWLVIFPSALGYLLYAYGISRRGAVSSSILMLATVLFGAFTSMLYLGDRLSWAAWMGLLAIGLALVMVSREGI